MEYPQVRRLVQLVCLGMHGDELAVQLMDELEPCCLGAAVHIVIWLLTSSTFYQTVLTLILFTRGTDLSREIHLSVLQAKL